MPDTDWHNHPEELDDLMPWSEVVQADYCLLGTMLLSTYGSRNTDFKYCIELFHNYDMIFIRKEVKYVYSNI